MESRTCLGIIFVASFASFLLSAEAYVFSVGGRDGWVVKPSEGYDPWAQRNRFLINDTLVFKYNSATDSVLVVNKQGYDSCSTSNPILRLTGGDSRFVFDRSGPFYFITGNQSNCQSGQKLVIVVLSPRTGTPPTTPTPSSPPIVAPANPPRTALTPSSPPTVAPANPPGTVLTPSSPPAVAPASPPATAPTPTSPPVVAPATPPGTAPTPSSPPVVARASPPGSAPTPSSPPAISPASPPGTAPSPPTTPATTPFASPPAPGAASPGSSGSLPGGSGAPGGSSSDTSPPRPSSSPVLSSSKVYTIGFSLLVTLALGSSLGFK